MMLNAQLSNWADLHMKSSIQVFTAQLHLCFGVKWILENLQPTPVSKYSCRGSIEYCSNQLNQLLLFKCLLIGGKS